MSFPIGWPNKQEVSIDLSVLPGTLQPFFTDTFDRADTAILTDTNWSESDSNNYISIASNKLDFFATSTTSVLSAACNTSKVLSGDFEVFLTSVFETDTVLPSTGQHVCRLTLTGTSGDRWFIDHRHNYNGTFVLAMGTDLGDIPQLTTGIQATEILKLKRVGDTVSAYHKVNNFWEFIADLTARVSTEDITTQQILWWCWNDNGVYHGTVDNYTINTQQPANFNETGFPLLLTNTDLESEVYQNILSDGADFRFSTDKTGQEKLDYYIKTLNQTLGIAQIFVKLPQVTPALTSVWLWYNNANANAESSPSLVWRDPQAATEMEIFQQPPIFDCRELFNDLTTNSWHTNIGTAIVSAGALDYTVVSGNLDLWAASAPTAFKPGSNGEDFEVYQDYNLIDCTSSGSTDYVFIRIGLQSLPSWIDFFQIRVERHADGTLLAAIMSQESMLANFIALPIAQGTIKFSRTNGTLKVYYWNPSTDKWEWNGATDGFTLIKADSRQYFMRDIFGSSASSSVHATLSNITVSSYLPRSSAWEVLKTASLTSLTGFLSSNPVQAAWPFTFGSNSLHIVPNRQIVNTLVGVVANVDSDTAIGTPSQQNVCYSGSAFLCSWADGNINLKGTRVWHGVSDIGPFWKDHTNTLTNGTCTDFGAAFFALTYNDGGIYQYGIKGSPSAYVVESESTYLLINNTQLGIYTYPSDMVSVSVASDWGTLGNPTPVLSYVSTTGDLVCASSANAPASYRAYDISITNILKTSLPNSADSISQSIVFQSAHFIFWSEYNSVGKYALKFMQHKEDASIQSDFSGWGDLTHWNSETALLDGSTEYLSNPGDFRFIAASRNGIGALLWRAGTTLKYKIFNSDMGEIASGTLTTSLPGTMFGFTGGLLYIPNRRTEFHFYYLNDNGDSTSAMALVKVQFTNTFSNYEPNLGTWPIIVHPEEIVLSALSLRNNRLSCEIKNPLVLGVLYHDSLNNLCMLKEQFWDFWNVEMHMGGADLACIGATQYYGMWAPRPIGPKEVLIAGQWLGSLYINIINSETGTLKWPYARRLNNKISDNHQATYAFVDSSGYLWLIGRGRVGAPESADLLILQSNKTISDPAFSADISLWQNKNPGIAAGRGYKTMIADQWGNIYVFWQFYGNMSIKIYSHSHQTWSAELPLVVSAGDNWPDDFRWRSRKLIKDEQEHFHLFYGLRSKADAPVTGSRGGFYTKIIPKDFSALTMTEFQNATNSRTFFESRKANGDPIPLPHDTTELISPCDCILKSTSMNAHTSSWGDNMITWTADMTVPFGQGIYDLVNEKCYVAMAFTTAPVDLTSFNDLSDFTISGAGSAGVTAANGICDIDLTSISGTVDTTGTLTTGLTGDFDIRCDFTIIDYTINATSNNQLGLQICSSGDFWTNYAALWVSLNVLTNGLQYTKASSGIQTKVPSTDLTGTIRLTRSGSLFRAFFWDSSNNIWQHFPDGLSITGQTVGTGTVDLNFWAKKADSSIWHVSLTNLQSHPMSGVTASTIPTAFSTNVSHGETFTDGTIIWTEYALFLDGFVRAYDWSGDILNPAKPVAGFNLDESSRDFVGEAPPLGAYEGTGFPWITFETDHWIIRHRTDHIARPTRMGVTNNNVGDLFISSFKTVINTKGYSIIMPITLKTKDCIDWEEVPFGLDADEMDSDIGSWYENPLGAPVGTDTTLAITEQYGQFTFFSTMQILRTAGLTTEFLGAFQGNFGGYF